MLSPYVLYHSCVKVDHHDKHFVRVLDQQGVFYLKLYDLWPNNQLLQLSFLTLISLSSLCCCYTYRFHNVIVQEVTMSWIGKWNIPTFKSIYVY